MTRQPKTEKKLLEGGKKRKTRQQKTEAKLFDGAKRGKFSIILHLYPNEIRKLEKAGLIVKILEESEIKHGGKNTLTVTVSWDHIKMDDLLLQDYICGKLYSFPNLATKLYVITRKAA